MHSDLKEIREIRKRHGLTQHGLAKKAGVSQSLIAKIESGRIDPTYTKTKKILDILNSVSEEKDMKAEEIMQKKIISVRLDEKIKNAIEKMRKYGISQLPVINGGIVGIVSESTILNRISLDKKTSVDDIISKIMEPAPPIINPKTGLSVVICMLKHFPILMVSEKGNLVGIITKSDLLKKVYRG